MTVKPFTSGSATRRVPWTDVATLERQEIDGLKTTALTIGVVAGVVVLLYGLAIATLEDGVWGPP
jgi:hypothetical protein